MSAVPEVMKSDVAATLAAAAVELATCACCGLKEECTPTYIAKVRDRHAGRWICGLCAEAVKDEISRAGRGITITPDEAFRRHVSFYEAARSPPPPASESAEALIATVRQLLRRSLESPRAPRSTPSSPRHPEHTIKRSQLSRSGSFFSTLAS